MHYILIWVQGSGKWTQAKKLVENHEFSTFSTWDALRDHVRNDTDLWKKVKSIMADGWLVDDEVIWEIVTDFLDKDENGKILFDGIPRNKEQKDMFDTLVSEYKVIFFQLDESVARWRLLGRMFDPETNETFVTWTKENPNTGTILVKRKDDNEEAISKRIDLFFNETMPILEEYREEWRVIEVNADQSIDKVFNELVEKLWLKK
jgi:adenylate kinase